MRGSKLVATSFFLLFRQVLSFHVIKMRVEIVETTSTPQLSNKKLFILRQKPQRRARR